MSPSIQVLDRELGEWATALRMSHGPAESLSRVDFAFDVELPEVDFNEDSFVTLAAKDAQHDYMPEKQTALALWVQRFTNAENALGGKAGDVPDPKKN